MSPRPREMENKSENQKPSYSKDVSPFKNGRSQSTDSLSSGNSSEKPQPVTPRITSFSSGGKIGGLNYSVPEKPKDAKRQETPIEREIRLARERESEYRVSKGLPPLEDVKKDDYELDDDEKDMIVVRSSNQSARAAGKDNIQRFASTRLQKEIDKQTAMEKQYLNEGKIKSTSEEHVGLVKYSEIAQDFSTTPKRNFSINKKGGSGNEPVTEHNGTTPDHKSSPKNSTPDQNVPKYNRSTPSGGVTFSYRESRHKAESKIEKELREMREREEELRSRRAVSGVVSPSSPRSPATSVVDKRSAFEQTS